MSKTRSLWPVPPSSRWRVLALLATVELLGMSLWFSASAVAPLLRQRWQIGEGEASWLTMGVQLGFVAGTAVAAVLNVADLWPMRRYVACCCTLGALANAALLVVPGLASALACRFLTGLFLAGVYPPAMKMVATWFRTGRGLAIGILVGALTIGKAAPYLIRVLEHTGVAAVILGVSGCALLAALLVVVGYEDGPHAFERRPFSWSLVVTVLLHRPTRLAIGGYLGHMWELYAMWTWIPAFLAASLQARPGAAAVAWLDDALAFGAIAAGGLGCVWGGWAADRIGRERLVNVAMAASGLCALGIGAAFGASTWLVGGIAAVWGFFVVADSAQFSTLVTEVAPRHAVGTALTLQTSLGFLLTLATIALIPALARGWGWQWAFPALALGPMAGIAAIARLARSRREADAASASPAASRSRG